MKSIFAVFFIFLIVTSGFSQVSRLPQARKNTQNLDKPRKDVRLPTRRSLFNKQTQKFMEERQEQFEFDLQSMPLETAVDPETYQVGPGDQFLVTIWAIIESSIPTKVTPEGNLVIQTIGTLAVQGLNLSEVKELVRKKASHKYRNAEISIELVQVRAIRVHVTGQVLNPGTYSVLAVHRVADAIELAGGVTSWAFEREIQVRHSDGARDNVDLHQYKKLGNIDANIYLSGGDVIFVPGIDLNRPTVRIEGAVNDPGIYGLKEHETLKDFLLRADALSRRAELRNAYVERKNGTNSHAEIIPIFQYLENSSNGHTDLILQDGDVINVPQRHEDVYVVGAVRYPGGYPYIPGFSLYDYVGLAGGTENSGSPDRAKLFRQIGGKKVTIDEFVVQAGDVVFMPRRVQFGIREILTLVTTVTNVLLTMKALDVL